MSTETTTPDRILRLPGDLRDRIGHYSRHRAENSDAEERGESIDWSHLDDEAHDIASEMDSLVTPNLPRDHVGEDADRDAHDAATVFLTVENIIDDEHLDDLVDAINGVGYTSEIQVQRNSDVNLTDILATADAIVGGESARTVEGLTLDYSDDTPGRLQINVAGEPDGEHPLNTYPDSAGLRQLEALFGALAFKVEQRKRAIAEENGE